VGGRDAGIVENRDFRRQKRAVIAIGNRQAAQDADHEGHGIHTLIETDRRLVTQPYNCGFGEMTSSGMTNDEIRMTKEIPNSNSQ
jgi:hypothetical protein